MSHFSLISSWASDSSTIQTAESAYPEEVLLGLLDKNSYLCSMNVVISEKGQVTIPKLLRDRLGIKAGQVLEFEEDHGRLVAVKVHRRDPVDQLYGVLHLARL